MKNHASTHTFDKAVRFRKVFFGIALNLFCDRSLRGKKKNDNQNDQK